MNKEGHSEEHDEFPPANEANAGTLFLDDYGLLWVCVFEDHPEIRDWMWTRVDK